MTPHYTGKRPATYRASDLQLADVLRALPAGLPNIPKPGGGYGMDFGPAGWQMLGNGPDDTVFPSFGGCGDCVWAGAAHETMELNYNVRAPVPVFDGRTVVSQYSTYSGYDPVTGANDNGSDVREVLTWRQTKGLEDVKGDFHHIAAYVSLEPGNLDLLWAALWLFEAVGIGIQFPQSAMDQFDSGQTWSVVPGTPTPTEGHYVPVVGHPRSGVWTAVTWARRQTMTPQFITTYCDEAWAYITTERYSRVTGLTPQGWRDVDLERFITLL